MIQEDQVFGDTFTLQRDDSVCLGDGPMFPQSTLRAILKTRKIFNDPTNTFVLFKPLARLFNPEIDDDKVKEIYTSVCTRGWDVVVVPLNKSYIESVPIPNCRDSSLRRPKLLFDSTYVCIRNKSKGNEVSIQQQDDRQEFFHMIKIIHQICHFMVPDLLRSCGVDIETIAKRATKDFESGLEEEAKVLEKQLKTPTHIGTTLREDRNPADPETYYIGDAGNAWEELTFGGRVMPCPNTISFPYRSKLILLRREYQDLPPTIGNQVQYRISDEYIQQALRSLEDWMPGTPFPHNIFTVLPQTSLKIAYADVYDSKDEVIEKSIAYKTRKRLVSTKPVLGYIGDECGGTVFGARCMCCRRPND